MRTLFLVLLTISCNSLFAQNGYIRLKNDSMLVGYLKYYVGIKDGQPGIEFWKTKKDKKPLKIPKLNIAEYAIKKDTFIVLHQFKPFHDSHTYFELVDAKLESSGKVNLYVIDNSQNQVSSYTGGGLIPAVIDLSLGNHPSIFVLENPKTGFLTALHPKKEKLKESLLDFFPDKYVLKYAEVNGDIRYKSVRGLVKLYNSK